MFIKKYHLKFIESKNLYYIYHKVSGYNSGKFCDGKTDLCIEGFESSANTFMFNAIYCLRPDLKYARHKHVVANLKLAKDHEVPMVILFRDPADCIPSLVSRFRPGPVESLYRYLSFYRYVVSEAAPNVLLISFEEAVGQVENTIRRIAQFADLEIEDEKIRNIGKKAKDRIRKNTQKRKGDKEISLPKKERDKEKNKIRNKIIKHDEYKEAQSIYTELKNIHAKQTENEEW